MNNPKVKKILEIGSNVLLYVFLAICLSSLALTIFAKKDSDGTPEVFGHQLRIVVSDSMAKCDATDVSDFEIGSIPIRSMVFVELVPEDEAEAKEWYDDLEIGDVLTFKYVYTTQVTITHRIVDIEEKGDGYIITLEGDNKDAETQLIKQTIDTTNTYSPNYVVGKVVGQSFLIGFILSILKSPVGLICVIIVPCAIVIIMEIIKIVGVLGEEKKKQADEENKKKDDELEELRRRLAQLEMAQTSPPPKAEAEMKAEPEVKAEAATESDSTDKGDESHCFPLNEGEKKGESNPESKAEATAEDTAEAEAETTDKNEAEATAEDKTEAEATHENEAETEAIAEAEAESETAPENEAESATEEAPEGGEDHAEEKPEE